MNKDERKQIFDSTHPNWQKKNRRTRIKYTPEMIAYIIKNYADCRNDEIAKELNIQPSRLAFISSKIRKKGVILKKNTEGNFDEAFAIYKDSLI